MPVISKPRYILRGKIRAQTRYAITIVDRLLLAYALNENLELFPGLITTTTADLAMVDILNLWDTALATKA